MESNYFFSRFSEDPNRRKMWDHLNRFFQKYVDLNGTTVELGAGYCYFINGIQSKKRIAVDLFPNLKNYINPGVEGHIRSATDLSFIPSQTVDTIFASNFLEHLSWPDLEKVMAECKRILAKQGRVLILQPNFKYSFRSYFDDYTHMTIFTDKSIADWFVSNGFKVEISAPKFLPLTVKSKLGKFGFLIPIYIRSPFKPFAGQMFLAFRKV